MKTSYITIAKSKKGSTLIWVLILMLVLGILITAGLAIAQSYSTKSVNQHYQKQSYYTAYSVTKSMAEWLQGTSVTTTTGGSISTDTTNTISEQQRFINQLQQSKKLEKNINISSGDMGSCVTTFEMTDKGDILISTKAEFQNESSVVSVTLKSKTETETIAGEPDEPYQSPDFPPFTIPDLDGAIVISGGDIKQINTGKFNITGNVEDKGTINGYAFISKILLSE